LLGSSHGRVIGPKLQEILGSNFEVSIIFKPNASLAKVVEGRAGTGLIEQDHSVVE
jgi:hypothetical protein